MVAIIPSRFVKNEQMTIPFFLWAAARRHTSSSSFIHHHHLTPLSNYLLLRSGLGVDQCFSSPLFTCSDHLAPCKSYAQPPRLHHRRRRRLRLRCSQGDGYLSSDTTNSTSVPALPLPPSLVFVLDGRCHYHLSTPPLASPLSNSHPPIPSTPSPSPPGRPERF